MTSSFACPKCHRKTDVELPSSSHMLGSGPPLTCRFTCSGCETVLNALTNGSVVWPDRPPKQGYESSNRPEVRRRRVPAGEPPLQLADLDESPQRPA